MPNAGLGELEEAILLNVLSQGAEAFALEVRRAIQGSTGRTVSRGAFYTTLERLERKGLVRWEDREPSDARRRGTQRRFQVTPAGVEALRQAREHLRSRWMRLGKALGER
jgi:DNA-binding PadR family transcriptional regulator